MLQIKPDEISSIRILPSDKGTYATEPEFKHFFEVLIPKRNGKYYYPSNPMNCPHNTLVLFQYDGMIRGIGVFDYSKKTIVHDEEGRKYAGYYQFYLDTLKYLDEPISKKDIQNAYPSFKSFNQSKQKIPVENLDLILSLFSVVTFQTKVNHKQISAFENDHIEKTERSALVKVRVNQSKFRDKLICRHKKCMLCGVENPDFLIASHIKPWSASEDYEKLCIANGLLLCANHDCLFDKGWITFDDNGSIIISDKISEKDKKLMNINPDMRIIISDDSIKFLKYHRESVFKH